MYTLIIDSGTSSTRAMLFSLSGKIIRTISYPIKSYYPKANWVEQCPEQLWNNTLKAIQTIVKTISVDDILAIGITNQRETTLIWDKRTGKCLSKAISWQDRRTQKICDELKAYEALIQSRTGLKLDPYFSATKIKWLLEHHQMTPKHLAFGTVDSFLLYKLTNGKAHLTDVTNASRTLLFDIKKLQWDEALLELFKIPKNLLPEVFASDHLFGALDEAILGKKIPIHAIIGDQQAALVGIGCIHPGQAKVTYGTGGFVLQHTGSTLKPSKHGLLSTIAYGIQNQTQYALEGNIYDAGSSLQWLKDGLGFFENFKQADKIASSIASNEGVYFMPAFSGIGAPHWITHVGACFLGLSRASGKAHMVRAVMEAIAYQTYDILKAMQQDSFLDIQHLLIDGGVANSRWLIQFIANLCQLDIEIPNTFENTAKGAAMVATLAAGHGEDLEQLAQGWQDYQTYHADGLQNQTNAYQKWLQYIEQFKQLGP